MAEMEEPAVRLGAEDRPPSDVADEELRVENDGRDGARAAPALMAIEAEDVVDEVLPVGEEPGDRDGSARGRIRPLEVRAPVVSGPSRRRACP